MPNCFTCKNSAERKTNQVFCEKCENRKISEAKISGPFKCANCHQAVFIYNLYSCADCSQDYTRRPRYY